MPKYQVILTTPHYHAYQVTADTPEEAKDLVLGGSGEYVHEWQDDDDAPNHHLTEEVQDG
jgi:hypothetical protein